MTPSVEYSMFVQNFYFQIRRDHQKISYERCVYESTDIRNLFLVIFHKFTENRTQKPKGYEFYLSSLVMKIAVLTNN